MKYKYYKFYIEVHIVYQVIVAPVLPPVALMMAKSPIIEQYDLSSMEEIFCAAAPFGGGLVKELKKRFPNLKRFRQGE